MRQLINELAKLPSIGEKSAMRLAYHLITKDHGEAQKLSEAITEAKQRTALCERCFALTEQEICEICLDERRDRRLLCVVEKPADLFAIERSGQFRGLYHVLHGLWSPLRGVSPRDIRIEELFKRLDQKTAEKTPIAEVILATGATVEGDATALFIAHHLQEQGVKVSRIAQGLPKGGELEYADEVTLGHALEGRRAVSG